MWLGVLEVRYNILAPFAQQQHQLRSSATYLRLRTIVDFHHLERLVYGKLAQLFDLTEILSLISRTMPAHTSHTTVRTRGRAEALMTRTAERIVSLLAASTGRRITITKARGRDRR